MAKKYNKTKIRVKCYTDEKETNQDTIVHTDLYVEGDMEVLLNSLQDVVSSIIYNCIIEDKTEDAINMFMEGVKDSIENRR